MASSPIAEKFLRSFEIGSIGNCWEWRAKRFPNRYGCLRYGSKGKTWLAHRFSFEIFYGHPPHGFIVRHDCDNPPCVNPSHLSIGTQADNARDKIKRFRSLKGTRCPAAKLTWKKVLEIRGLYKTGRFTQVQLGRKFGVNQSHISSLVNEIKRKDM